MTASLRWMVVLAMSAWALAGGAGAGPQGGDAAASVLVGRPTDRGVTVSVLASAAGACFVEYAAEPGGEMQRTPAKAVQAGVPAEFEITGLVPATRYGYRVRWTGGGGSADGRGGGWFRTCRRAGEAFVFGVQGDSHPERLGRMFDPALYERTLANAAADGADFYFLMGDDFSIERLIERGERSAAAVNAVYARQRAFLDDLGGSTPLMLVNGNHEQAAKYLLDGTPGSFAVLAGRARTTYFPLPGPEGFFSGNRTPVEHVGLVRDYYAWEWGDALFVVIDPYWHSDVAVDNEAGERGPARDGRGEGKGGGKGGGGRGQRDLWKVTLGDEQYRWLRATLVQSRAKFKFVFSHHVLGTGRGGVEQAGLYEWGGRDRRGVNRFFEMRPTWEQPIHDLMRDAGVTIFFQGHDHLYARQELDGVVYQTCPNPADPTFTAFNREAYRSGDVFANSGHLRVTVTGGPDAACRVEYVRSLRASDEKDGLKNGTVVHAYTVRPRTAKAPGAARETSR